MKFCKGYGCPNLIEKGIYCPEHKPVLKRVKTKQDDYYSSAAWIRFRNWFKVQYPLCPCGKPGEQVHHKVPLTSANDPLALVESNCQNLCRACHNKEHDRFKAGKGKVYEYAQVQAQPQHDVFRF